jgi:hypothetical protein
MTPLKVRRILEPLGGMEAQRALVILGALPHAAAVPVAKVLRSAIANAEEKGLDVDNMYIAQLTADEGTGVMPAGDGEPAGEAGGAIALFVTIFPHHCGSGRAG